MAPKDAQKTLRDLGVSHGVMTMDMHAAVQVDVKQAAIMKQVHKVMYDQLERNMTVEQLSLIHISEPTRLALI
eukprot:11908835-Alexandrium_andersonii.AAC.1